MRTILNKKKTYQINLKFIFSFHLELHFNCLARLMLLLCSRFPNVRTKTADTLYSNLLIFGDLILENEEDKLEEVMRLLSDTVWSKSDSTRLKEIRKRICNLLNVPEPVPLIKKS